MLKSSRSMVVMPHPIADAFVRLHYSASQFHDFKWAGPSRAMGAIFSDREPMAVELKKLHTFSDQYCNFVRVELSDDEVDGAFFWENPERNAGTYLNGKRTTSTALSRSKEELPTRAAFFADTLMHITWAFKAESGNIGKHPAAMFDKGFDLFDDDVACIEADGGARVYLTMCRKPSSERALLDAGIELLARKRNRVSCQRVVMPCVSLTKTTNYINSVANIELKSADHPGLKFTSFEQNVDFVMDEEGAKAKARTTARMMTKSASSPRVFVLNKPFLVVVQLPDSTYPALVAYADKDCWHAAA